MMHTFFPEVISLLLAHGADKTIEDKNGRTALTSGDTSMCMICLIPCFWIVVPCLCVSFCEARSLLKV